MIRHFPSRVRHRGASPPSSQHHSSAKDCSAQTGGARDAAPATPLTLPPATADLPEAGALAQTVEPLLFDQLHDLGLDLLSQLSAGKRHSLDEEK